jgi:hypothetical protein
MEPPVAPPSAPPKAPKLAYNKELLTFLGAAMAADFTGAELAGVVKQLYVKLNDQHAEVLMTGGQHRFQQAVSTYVKRGAPALQPIAAFQEGNKTSKKKKKKKNLGREHVFFSC